MRVVAAVDFSQHARRVVELGARLAAGGELILLHVAPPDPAFVGYEVGPQPIRDFTAKKLRGHHRDLQALGEAVDDSTVDVKALMAQGPTAEQIVEEADKLGADLLVIGSHGHGALYTLVVGSTAEGVLRKSTVPVVILPREDHPDESAS